MPKQFLWFLLIAQLILTAYYALVYFLITLFFFSMLAHQALLAFGLFLASLSFFGFLILTHNRDHWFLNACNIIANVWMVLVFYFSIFSLLTLLLYSLNILPLNAAGYLAIFIALALTLYGLVNARSIRVITVKINMPNLPAFWKNKTAILASDIHLGQILTAPFAKRVVKRINQENPEIVFIPGDFFDGTKNDFSGASAPFKNITAPFGTYFCSGNHEMFAGYELCERHIAEVGIKILENSMVEVQGLQIAGIAYKTEIMTNLKEKIAGFNLDKTKPSILLKHVPSQIKEVAEAGINLMLSGHTHQGQIWPFRYITQRVYKGYDYGLKAFQNLQVYTSSGVGSWGPPVRVFTKSEIIKIIFE